MTKAVEDYVQKPDETSKISDTVAQKCIEQWTDFKLK